MLPAKFGSIWPSSFRGEDFLTLANQKQELPLSAIFVGGTKLGRKHLCKILYKISAFNFIRPTNMAAVTKNRTYGKIARFW
jgi:hypothetical protein